MWVGALGLLLLGCGAPPGAPSPERVAAESAAMARITPLVRQHGADVAWSARLAGPTSWRTTPVPLEELTSEWARGRVVAMAGTLLAFEPGSDGTTRVLVQHTQLSDGARLFGTALYLDVRCASTQAAALQAIAADPQRVSGLFVDAFVIVRLGEVTDRPPPEHRGFSEPRVGHGECLAVTKGSHLPFDWVARLQGP